LLKWHVHIDLFVVDASQKQRIQDDQTDNGVIEVRVHDEPDKLLSNPVVMFQQVKRTDRELLTVAMECKDGIRILFIKVFFV
jgi:hypothetical protein